ncbi:MAG: aldehyde dehydrogenase family protein, partial [Candidatus Woesearchaeota archaeon]
MGFFSKSNSRQYCCIKTSEECPLCGKFIENIFSNNLPESVFNEIYGDSEVGKMLISQNINMIMFTGSTKTGQFLYKTAGEKFIKAVMELGGSAPGIVFEDANIDSAIENICFNRLFNSGQCCDGLKRLIVHKNIFNEIVEKLSLAFKNKKVGIAEDPNTEMGPLVAKRQLDLLISQVEDAKEKGANIVVGGGLLKNQFNGAFFELTILTNITKD